MSERTYRQLERAQTLITQQRMAEASTLLDTLLSQSKNTYEQAMIHQNMAYIALNQDQYPKAIQHFESALQGQTYPNQSSATCNTIWLNYTHNKNTLNKRLIG